MLRLYCALLADDSTFRAYLLGGISEDDIRQPGPPSPAVEADRSRPRRCSYERSEKRRTDGDHEGLGRQPFHQRGPAPNDSEEVLLDNPLSSLVYRDDDPCCVPFPKEMLKVVQDRGLMRLSRGTLWKLVSMGEVEAARVGRAVRINRESLTGYMRRSTAGLADTARG